MTTSKTYRIGSAEVTRVHELSLDDFTPAALLPDWSDADDRTVRRHPGAFTPDGRRALLSVHSWLVRDRGRTTLIDTGAGNGKHRPHARYFDRLDTPYLDRLAAAGVEPEAVDYVLHHPAQVERPALASVLDADTEATLRSRNWALDRAAENGALLFSSHFPSTSAGRVARDGDSYVWRFE